MGFTPSLDTATPSNLLKINPSLLWVSDETVRDSVLRLLRSPIVRREGSGRNTFKHFRGPSLWVATWDLYDLYEFRTKDFTATPWALSLDHAFLKVPCVSSLIWCNLTLIILIIKISICSKLFSIIFQKKRLKFFRVIKFWLVFINSFSSVYLSLSFHIFYKKE